MSASIAETFSKPEDLRAAISEQLRSTPTTSEA
jgi:hypothetical protein